MARSSAAGRLDPRRRRDSPDPPASAAPALFPASFARRTSSPADLRVGDAPLAAGGRRAPLAQRPLTLRPPRGPPPARWAAPSLPRPSRGLPPFGPADSLQPPPAWAKPARSSESVRNVRIRSTTLARLLHGLVLLPSGISVAGTGNAMI